MTDGDVGGVEDVGGTSYEPQPKQLPEDLQALTFTRSMFEQNGKPMKCSCGGWVVGLHDGEMVLGGHTRQMRQGYVVGGCHRAIVDVEG